ncbi:Mitogen-activated protein kinase kinase kinase kinase 4 [Crenichthys baileyi]|uniref:non-specific serine/threonine protein kinase n=1 Tax=Crenichthys baileyi TaxID=28760 RepID=A0AAV9RC43_9TELE
MLQHSLNPTTEKHQPGHKDRRNSSMGAYEEKKETCGTVCLKYLLFSFNFLFWLAGGVVMAVGVWTLVEKSDYISLLPSKTYATSAYILVLAGAIVMVTGVLGCCATFKEQRKLLRVACEKLFPLLGSVKKRAVPELEVHYRKGFVTSGSSVKYERIKFLVLALKNSVEVYAWAPKPYHKFMAFKSFGDLVHKPLLVDLTVEEGQRLKVIYGSCSGFHAVDVDSGAVYDIYLPTHIQNNIQSHAIIILPNTDGIELLVCYEDEGVYVNTYGRITKDVVLQWGEMPTSVAYIRSNQIMGWGEKAIEIRSVETGHLDGVFMHKRAQRLKFLCERNDKVFFASVRAGGSSQVYFMTLGRSNLLSW